MTWSRSSGIAKPGGNGGLQIQGTHLPMKSQILKLGPWWDMIFHSYPTFYHGMRTDNLEQMGIFEFEQNFIYKNW